MNDSAEVKKEQIKEQAGEGNVKAYDIMRVLLTVVIVADHALYLSMTYGFGEWIMRRRNALGIALAQMFAR